MVATTEFADAGRPAHVDMVEADDGSNELDGFGHQLRYQLECFRKVAEGEIMSTESMASMKEPLRDDRDDVADDNLAEARYDLEHCHLRLKMDDVDDAPKDDNYVFGDLLNMVGSGYDEGEKPGDDGDAATCDSTPLLGVDIDKDSDSDCSTGSESSVIEPFKKDRTLVILDWDDTLCPSSELMYQLGLSVAGTPPQEEVAAQLAELTKAAKALIEQCLELADKVVIVTNGTQGWVDSCAKAWMPGLLDLIEKVEVTSARSIWEPHGITCPTKWKEREFQNLVEKFRCTYQRESWKHLITVGDALHEHEALKAVVRETPWYRARRYRTKTMKFVIKPSISELQNELESLTGSMKEVLTFDGDLSLILSRCE
eukprot:TRINITY_DN112006_c0_g1_i1.p1 TRINITY_DN112006_c0_g1~~TRINITY_DN112006_c0_g1_i1.p1  ORF type:complete len:371 (+),score=95.82 TRINITY_DN112006_c0_g1_i1:96-1208(+)